ncbi:MAG: hypothetical protein RIQ52_938, partial [Pseudomonadota bacterium]
MPAFLTDIQALLSQWYQLSLDNIAYVITLVLVVWLPFNLYHRFRLAIAGRRHAQVSRQLAETQSRLEHMEREAATLRQEAADQRAVLEAERQASADLAQQHAGLQRTWQQRNRQLADMLHDLVHSLSLPDMAILFRSGGDDDAVWQSSNHCVVKLGERLRSEMQGRQDVERSFRGLQETLAARDTQIQRLENQLQQQLLLHKALQEKQEKLEIAAPVAPQPAQQAMPHHELASLLAQYQAGMLAEAAPVMPAPVAAGPVAVTPVVPEVPVPPPVTEAPPAPPASVEIPEPQPPVAEIPPATAAIQEAVPAPASTAKKGGLLGGLFGKKAPAAAPPAPAPAAVAVTPPPAQVAQVPPAAPAPVLAEPVVPAVVVPPPVQPAPAVSATIPQPQPAVAQPQKKTGF